MFWSLSEKPRTARPVHCYAGTGASAIARHSGKPVSGRRIEIHLGVRTAALTLSRQRQILLVLLLFAGAAAAGWIGTRDLSWRAQLHARRAETREAAAANAALRTYAARLHRQLAQTALELAQADDRIAAHERVAAAVRTALSAAEQQLQRLHTLQAANPPARTAAAGVPGGAVAHLTQALAEAERQQQAAAAERSALTGRLAAAQSDLDRDQERARDLALALLRLTARLKTFVPQPTAQSAVLQTAGSSGVLGRVEQALVSAGIDARRFFASFGIRRGVGGPFIPARDAPNPAQLAVRQNAVATMLKALPVAAPLPYYRETSPFGIRHNPFTGRGEEFHPGIDLAAPYETPVYATAPGIVTYAGWESGYGKIVRIDHGHGLSTGYGHLHAFTVVVGERVSAGTQVGYEGSTGRSTGPHVIYEVRLNGKVVNPAPFLALGHEIAPSAGRIIPAAAR